MGAGEKLLLVAWQNGDPAAGDELVRAHWPDLLRFFIASTGGDRAAAEDLAQETCITVVSHRDDIRTSFRAYCYGVARMKRFEAGRRRRARAREVSLENELFGLGSPDSPEELARAKLVVNVLRRLELDEQLILILKDYLGFTQPELAETFKIPQSRVAGRIHRARRHFRREFEGLELDAREQDLTARSLNTVLASIVAQLPARLELSLKRRGT